MSFKQIQSFAGSFKWSALVSSPAVMVMVCTNCSVSVELTLVLSAASYRGALDNVSAVYKNFPGTWWMMYQNHLGHSLNCSTQGGNKPRPFWPKNSMRGLLSVSTRDNFANNIF